MNSKDLFFVFVCLTVGLLLCVAGFTYTVDPDGLFKDDEYYTEIVDILLNGSNVTDYGLNLDEGKYRTEYISRDPIHRDVIILGSSHVALIDDVIFSCIISESNHYMNNFNSGSNIIDEIGLFGLYLQKENIPKYLIIGLDPWSLNSEYAPNGRLGLDRCVIMKKIGSSSHISIFDTLTLGKYPTLLSRIYLVKSVNNLMNMNMSDDKKERVNATELRFGLNNIINMDGTISYGEKFVKKSFDDVENETKNYLLSDSPLFYNNLYELSPELIDIFTNFVEYAQNQNITIYFYLSPQHPLVYEKILSNPEYEMVIEEEKFFRSFADDHTITVIGSFDPRPWNLTSADFYDWHHPRYAAIGRIFKSAANQSNLSCERTTG